jgi:uncharacterized protein (DUF697 family)
MGEVKMDFDAGYMRSNAKEIIDKYAKFHAGTAFIVGQIPGGMLGFDAIPLTALTVKMINEICDLYGVRSNSARAIFTTHAIARLTVKGTAVANTILKWIYIPLLSPAATTVTTFYLTKQAGWDCVKDIENKYMEDPTGALLGVIKKEANRLALTGISSGVKDFVAPAVDYFVGDLDDLDKLQLDMKDPFVDEKVIEDIINRSELNEGKKALLAKFIETLVKDRIEKGEVNPVEAMKAAIIEGISKGFSEGAENGSDYHQAVRDNLKMIDEHFPGFFDNASDLIDQYAKAVTQDTRKAILSDFISDAKMVAKELALNYDKRRFQFDHNQPLVSSINGFDPVDYFNFIEETYQEFLSPIDQTDSLDYVYGQCGKIFERIQKKNLEVGLWKTPYEFDHVLVYFIAGQLRNSIINNQVSRMSQEKLAEGITESILRWVQGENKN